MTKCYVTNRELVVKYRGQSKYPDWDGVEVRIPAGHPVDRRDGGTDAQGNNPAVWYFAGNPGALLDRKTQSTLLHDATYYGIPIPADAVSEA